MQKGIYKHYKGNMYRILGFGKNSETLEEMVFYEALYGNPISKFWIRPLRMFGEEVDTPDGKKKRFVFIKEN